MGNSRSDFTSSPREDAPVINQERPCVRPTGKGFFVLKEVRPGWAGFVSYSHFSFRNECGCQQIWRGFTSAWGFLAASLPSLRLTSRLGQRALTSPRHLDFIASAWRGDCPPPAAAPAPQRRSPPSSDPDPGKAPPPPVTSGTVFVSKEECSCRAAGASCRWGSPLADTVR